MRVWPWWVRLALWAAGIQVENVKPILLPPPVAALPELRPETVAKALELRARDELLERLWVLDGYLWVALHGSVLRLVDTRWRS